MKFSTQVIKTIEMTQAESNSLWEMPHDSTFVLERKVRHWDTNDGNNLIQLEGDTFYHEVVIVD